MSTFWSSALMFLECCGISTVLLYAGIVAHEAGHALAALAFGAEVRGISLCTGRALFEGSVRGVPYRVGWIPGSGYVSVRMDSGVPRFRLRVAAIFAAGPAVNLVAGVVAAVTALDALWGLSVVVSSATLLLIGLAPADGASDGDVLWALLRGRDVPSDPAAAQAGGPS